MSANVRRLALDISPWIWVFVAVMTAGAVFGNIQLLMHSLKVGQDLSPGLLMFLPGSMGAVKVAFWRTLPVTRSEIDRARWLQMIAGPGLLLFATLLGPALTMDAYGLAHAAWVDIVLLALAQFALGVAFTSIMFVVIPLAAQNWGIGGRLLLIPALLAYFWVMEQHLQGHLASRPALAAAGAAALLAVAALYLLAGRWPMPLASLWNAPAKEREPLSPDVKKPAGPRGWRNLLQSGLPNLAIPFLFVVLMPSAMIWEIPRVDLTFTLVVVPLPAMQFAQFCASMIRGLRVSPLTGRQLSCRLVLILLALQVISLLLFLTTISLLGQGIFPPALFLTPLALTLLFFPAAMRFGRIVGVMLFGVPVVFFSSMLILHLGSGAAIPIILASLAAIAAGIAWTYWEIAHGHHAYRAQPLVTQRWSGVK